MRSWKRHLTPRAPEKFSFLLVGNPRAALLEPKLLEALANHPQCEAIWYIPKPHTETYNDFTLEALLESEEQVASYREMLGDKIPDELPTVQLEGYDLKPLLKQADKASSHQKLSDYGNLPALQPVPLDACNVYLGGSSSVELHQLMLKIVPQLISLNDWKQAAVANQKTSLPRFLKYADRVLANELLPKCTVVTSYDAIKSFMQKSGLSRVILKSDISGGGSGIYIAETDASTGKLIIQNASTYNQRTEQPPSAPIISSDTPYLAMEELDISQGDLRVICAYGNLIGGYNRYAKPDSLLCNVNQGGRIEKADLSGILSEKDYESLDLLAEELDDEGIHYACIDLLADDTGKRYISEINSGLVTYSLNRLHEHGDTSAGTRVASRLIRYCDQQRQMENTIRQFMR